MLDYLVFMGIAYGVACLISGIKPNLWTAVFGGLAGLLIGWAGGLTLQLGVPHWLFGIDLNESIVELVGRGFWMALLGACIGAAQGRKGQSTAAGWSLLGARSWRGALLGVLVAAVASNVVHATFRHSTKPYVFDSTSAVLEPDLVDEFGIDNSSYRSADEPAYVAPATSSQPELDPAVVDAHLRKIYAAHPDADRVASNPAFDYWVAEATERKRIFNEGTASEVITLLSQYKSYQLKLQANSQQRPERQNVQQATTYQPTYPVTGNGNSQGCEYRAVMTNDDYLACGISPPSKN